jgi:hypothetical protein
MVPWEDFSFTTDPKGRSKAENPIMIIGYWLKPVIITEVAGWPKSLTGSCNRVTG